MRIVFIVACLMLAACGGTKAPTPAASASSTAPSDAGGRVVVMLGDSLTAGYQLEPSQALPEAVGRALAAKGVEARMVNAGVSGATTADGLQSYDFSVAGQHSDLLVVALGANDFLQGQPAATPEQNLKAIIDKAKAAHLPVALMGISVPETVKSTDGREAAYAEVWSKVAKAEDVPLLADMLAPVHGKPDLLLSDGLHPTPQGVEAMAAPIADFLTPLILALPRRP